ncbi:MAG TPA: WbqC family protein [Candidatus Nitrosotalea sp.]|nr:WbqC family protein [Candidatus Nitrosotalea sp.]
MKAVIHQANYFPYVGFFHKISMADTLVLMDDTQYDKKFTNRNKIIVPNGWIWLSVPINKDHKFFVNRLVEINNDIEWKQDHWKKIQQSYAKAEFFKEYQNYFTNLYSTNWEFLFELNYEILLKVIDWLDIKIEIMRESELNINGSSTKRLVNICKAIGADTYLSGAGGKGYIEEEMFKKNEIKLVYQKFIHPVYPQRFVKEFIPDLSIIDMLFNVGSRTMKMIKEANEE